MQKKRGNTRSSCSTDTSNVLASAHKCIHDWQAHVHLVHISITTKVKLKYCICRLFGFRDKHETAQT